jgi:NAD(P)-dependent dehydrogenase (short-subunit alcohol dehydrogenase family)
VWRDTVDLGAGSAYAASALAAPYLIATAARADTALIVNISGRGALRHRYNVVYGIGKSAVERLTRDAALELREHTVAVVSVWPNAYVIGSEPPETPRYSGRAVAALASDDAVMTKSGRHFWAAELANEYGFTDEHGHTHSVAELTDENSLEHDASR